MKPETPPGDHARNPLRYMWLQAASGASFAAGAVPTERGLTAVATGVPYWEWEALYPR